MRLEVMRMKLEEAFDPNDRETLPSSDKLCLLHLMRMHFTFRPERKTYISYKLI